MKQSKWAIHFSRFHNYCADFFRLDKKPGVVRTYSPEKDALQFRVDRLLSGDFRIDDLSVLFLTSRERCSDLSIVAEIGDLIAHRYSRNKGLLHEIAQGVFDSLVVMAHDMQDPDGGLPPRYWEGLNAALRALNPQKLRRDTGLTPKRAKLVLRTMAERNANITDGRSLRLEVGHRKYNLVKYLSAQGATRAPFTDKQLIKELNIALKRQDISKKTIKGDAATFVTLFVLSQLHNTAFVLKDGAPHSSVFLEGSGRGIVAWLRTHAPVIDKKRNKVAFPNKFICTPHFTTSLNEEEHIDLSTITSEDGRDYSVEVTPDLKLSLLK